MVWEKGIKVENEGKQEGSDGKGILGEKTIGRKETTT